MARPPIVAASVLVLLVFASVAGAEEIVPPSNSAASQYTEAFPTAGGEEETGDSKPSKTVPGEVLGAKNSRRLESKGEEGKDVAEFAADTAPAPVAESPAASGGADGAGGEDADRSGAGGGNSKGNGGTGSGQGTASGSASAGPGAERPDGSSGSGEVASQIFGTSSGDLGLWLPLIVIGAVVWSLVYLRRHRQRVI